MSVYEQDTVLVSTDELGNPVVHLPMSRANNIEGLGRYASTAYEVGDLVYVDSDKSVALLCVTAGTTSAGELDISSNSAGDTVADGGVVWKVVKREVPEMASEAESLAGVLTNKTVSPSTAHKIALLRIEEREAQRKVSEFLAVCPVGYKANALFGSNFTKLTVTKGLKVVVGDSLYESEADVILDVTTVQASASSRAGANYYVYACVPTSGTEPVFVLSANSTVPDGYTADNSRKIGGFHCLCASVGSISGHDLSGYSQGDILPMSVWDLHHRPDSDYPEGMAYEPICDVWWYIYLASWNGSRLVSQYKGTTADGASSKKFHGELFAEEFRKNGERLPWREEFVWAARGSNEETNITGSTDKITTGGWTDTAGRRMISNIGLEDCCGFLWQWTQNLGFAGGSGWTESVYNSGVDDTQRGQIYGTLYRLVVGGYWDHGANCGSRSAGCNLASSHVNAGIGGRGAVEPRNRKAYRN